MGGDSIAVLDYRLGRLTVLDPSGDLARIVLLQETSGRVIQLRSIYDSAFVSLGFSLESIPNEPGSYRVPYQILYLSPSGRIIDTVAVIRGFEGYQNAAGSASIPFGKDGHIATRGQDLIIGTSDMLGFERYDETLTHVQSVRAPRFELQLSPQEIDSTRQSMFVDGLPPEIMDLLEGVEIPASKPAYSKLLIDQGGFVWAAEYYARGGPEGAVDWNVFAPNGEWLGSVETPARFNVFEVGPDYLLGVKRDEMGVEHVQILRLRRS